MPFHVQKSSTKLFALLWQQTRWQSQPAAVLPAVAFSALSRGPAVTCSTRLFDWKNSWGATRHPCSHRSVAAGNEAQSVCAPQGILPCFWEIFAWGPREIQQTAKAHQIETIHQVQPINLFLCRTMSNCTNTWEQSQMLLADKQTRNHSTYEPGRLQHKKSPLPKAFSGSAIVDAYKSRASCCL